MPFRQYVSSFISGDETIPDKDKKKLYKRFGYPPEELGIGQLVDYMKQTPFQLGFADTNDLALLYRCMHAQSAYRIAQHLPQRTSDLSLEEGLIVGRVKDIINKKRRMSRGRLNEVAVFDFTKKR